MPAENQGDMLPCGYVLAFLPALGANRRLPAFWGDREVRRIVVAQHRQMTVEQLRDLLRERFGSARTPSKSALARTWQRIDAAIAGSRSRAVRGGC